MKRAIVLPCYGSGRIVCLPDGRQYPVKAWTGGPPPPPLSPTLRSVRTALFREQVGDWRAFWGDAPDRSTLRLFFNRATHDADATLNH